MGNKGGGDAAGNVPDFTKLANDYQFTEMEAR